MRARTAALLLVAFLSVPASAQWRGWEAEFDEETKPWKEIEARLPAYPLAANLVAFEASAASPHRFYVDAAALSVGEDGVVRYTLVVKSAGGATNISFEGIRCETREHKVYAVGRPDGGWTRARDPKWRRIEDREVNRHHFVLYADFFCPGRRAPARLAEIREALGREAARLR
jgi:hypothetical protein